jgi:ABC-2 type transport system permease protein
MFGQIFVKRLKLAIRNKQDLFWTLLFPILLSTLFFVTFGGIYKTYSSEAIETAVVFETENEEIKNNITNFLENLMMDDHKMLNITYTDYTTAEGLLKDDEKVNGIISVGDNGKLELALYSNGVLSTIQENIVTVYNQNVDLIEKTAKEHPEKLADVLQGVYDRISYIKAHDMAGENKDPFLNYFYNLIAMATLFASFSSLRIGNSCQANMSSIGARTNASPVSRSTFQIASLLATYLVQTAVTLIGLTYMIFILRIEFGGDIPMIYVTTAIATLVGTALGFFAGNIGSMAVEKKESILVAISLTGCALSGLMYGDMKVIIAEKMPIINKINPAAVISDSYYCLNMFGTNGRYAETIIYMLGISIVLVGLGLIMGRRNHYDSI